MAFAGQIALALLSGCMLALSLSGLDVFWLAWVAHVPLLVALHRAGRGRAFLIAAVAGVVEAAGILYWLPGAIHFMAGSYTLGFAFLIVHSLAWAVCFGGALCFGHWTVRGRAAPAARRKAMALRLAFIPALFVTFELLWSHAAIHVSSVFLPLIGYSQWSCPVLLQIAAYAGVYGLTFLVVFVNVAVTEAVLRISWKPVLPAAVLLLFCTAVGIIRLKTPNAAASGQMIRVAVLQANIEPWDKLDKTKGDILARRYLDLNRKAAVLDPGLVVWPEAAVPWPLEEGDDLVEAALDITRPAGSYHIVGAPCRTIKGREGFHNTAFLVAPDKRVIAVYHKVRMLSFIETPVRLPGASRALRLHPSTSAYVPATDSRVLPSPPATIGVNICNESFYADLTRRSVREGAELIVSMSNDGWLPASTAVRQHFGPNILRAVESGRDLVVANNVGISAIIDAYGRIAHRTKIRTETVFAGPVALRSGRTFYTRHGDTFAWLCTCLCAALAVVASRRPRNCRNH